MKCQILFPGENINNLSSADKHVKIIEVDLFIFFLKIKMYLCFSFFRATIFNGAGTCDNDTYRIYANNERSVATAHPRSLTGAFIVSTHIVEN